jgi:hypothetical protein
VDCARRGACKLRPCKRHSVRMVPFPLKYSLSVPNTRPPKHIDVLPRPRICTCTLLRTTPTASSPFALPCSCLLRLDVCARPGSPLYFISCIPAPLQHSSRLSRPFRCPKRVRPRRRLHAPSVCQYRGRQVRLSVWHVQPDIRSSPHIENSHGHRPASVASD